VKIFASFDAISSLALLCLMAALSAHSAEAQRPNRIARLGILRTGAPPDPLIDAFRQGLRQLGYIEGKNVIVEYRWAEGKNERLAELATELVRIKVDVIIAAGPGPILAAKQATNKIPIVMPVVINPVGSGLVQSLAHPGGNLTGLTSQTDELLGKWMELIKEILPKAHHIVALVDSPNEIGQSKSAEEAARSLNFGFQVLRVSSVADFSGAFEMARKKNADAMLQLPSAFLYAHRMPFTSIKSSKGLSLPIFPLNNQQSLSWSSISKPPSKSA